MRRTAPNTILAVALALAGSGCLQAAKRHPASAPPASLQTAGARRSSSNLASPASTYRAVLDRYCVTCHNDRLRTANLMLDTVEVEQVSRRAAVWEKVVRKLRTRTMPPSGRPRLDRATYDGFASWLETELDRAAMASPNPGRPPAFHRFNRAEYHNAIRDLLALDIDVPSLLPADDSSYGFDNIGDILGVSPTLLEGYLAAARRISQEAVGDPAITPDTYTYRVAPDLTQDYRLDGLPFGTRGGTLVRHHFPVDGEYLIKIQLLRNFIGGRIMGLSEPHQLELTLDGQRIQLFTVGNKKPAAGQGERENQSQSYAKNVPEDAGLQVRLAVKAGARSVGVAFLQRPSAQVEDLRQPYLRSFAILAATADGLPHVASVVINGPYDALEGDTPSRRRIFVCRPASPAEEPACAKRILTTLAGRAYRRPVTDADVQTLLTFYETGRVTGGGFEVGIQKALQRLLMSPDFLFRIERDPVNLKPKANYRISDLELASRLSFFLWSSIPDDELLELAERSRLHNPKVLEQQVHRMLRDARSHALVSNFAGQWLYLRNIPAARPDPQVFPDFDENLRQAMRRETELLFETIMREDRSLLDLLGARYTFLNERLARHYGIPNIYGSHFRRVALGDDSVRGGLLGQASILTVTSYPTRTSPVLRGKWLLENILGTPAPPPPPDVPELEETSPDGKPRSMREVMVQHRANPVCASCHSRMDPLGFALEHFDASGAWRTTEAHTLIDASGTLPDGTTFEGPAELRRALLSYPEQFVTILTERLLTYALGRGLEYYDNPAVRAITRHAARNDYRFSALIRGIVESVPFQMRRSQS